MEVIDSIVQFVNNKDCVKPGQPVTFTSACVDGDRIWQGDLALTIRSKIPKDYVPCENPKLQLVHGSNIGSKHCLDSLDGVTMYVPENWDQESLVGPYLILKKDRVVEHPVHGNVTILGGTSVHCTYQREYDSELRKERRARD